MADIDKALAILDRWIGKAPGYEDLGEARRILYSLGHELRGQRERAVEAVEECDRLRADSAAVRPPAASTQTLVEAVNHSLRNQCPQGNLPAWLSFTWLADDIAAALAVPPQPATSTRTLVGAALFNLEYRGGPTEQTIARKLRAALANVGWVSSEPVQSERKSLDEPAPCPTCHGREYVDNANPDGQSRVLGAEECPECGITGRVPPPEQHGTGRAGGGKGAE